MQRRYIILDVFSQVSLAGNQLAVVLDSDGLDQDLMQKIAREFNLAETIFIFPPNDKNNLARVKIFTPMNELPFAGHPTVGVSTVVARLNNIQSGEFILEEEIGLVPCQVNLSDENNYAEFKIPQLAKILMDEIDINLLSDALGLKVEDFNFENHIPTISSAGVEFIFAPINNAQAIKNISVNEEKWRSFMKHLSYEDENRLPALYAYHKLENQHYDVRMFAPLWGISEDPATGAAAAGFTAVIEAYDGLKEGLHEIKISQGIEMGRPSYIDLKMQIKNSKCIEAIIGGYVSKFAEGILEI